MKKNRKLLLLLLIIGVASLAYWLSQPADLRPDVLRVEGLTSDNQARGRQILSEVLKAMHAEHLHPDTTYEITFVDHWERTLGLNFSPWPGENGALLRLRARPQTFDSQVEWLSGTGQGERVGLQFWQLYRQLPGEAAQKVAFDQELGFIIPTVQYFNELPLRLTQASVVAYAGQEQHGDQTYDLIFATWDTPEPNRHDQYLLYVDPQTHHVDRIAYTIRDNFMWTPARFYGTGLYSDFREASGVVLPFRLDIYPFNWTNLLKLHTLHIQDFRWGMTSGTHLYPFPDLAPVGDAKPR